MVIYNRMKVDNKISEINYSHFGDLFANPSKEDIINLDKLKLIELKYKAVDAYRIICAKSDTNYRMSYNVGIIFYDLIDLEKDNPKEKIEMVDSSIVWLDKSFEFLKHKYDIEGNSDKSLLNKSTDFIKSITKKKTKIDFALVDKNIFNKSRENLINLYRIKRDTYIGKDTNSYKLYDKKMKEVEKISIVQ